MTTPKRALSPFNFVAVLALFLGAVLSAIIGATIFVDGYSNGHYQASAVRAISTFALVVVTLALICYIPLYLIRAERPQATSPRFPAAGTKR